MVRTDTAERKRGGRRGGEADTRGDILRAARAQFGAGYDATSVRGVAREAGVDPSLVIQYFGGKDGLFEAVLADAIRPEEGIDPVLAGAPAGFGHRLAASFFAVWEDPARRAPLQAMLVSAASNETARELLQRFVTAQVVARVASVSRREDATLRAELVGSQLIGAALVRYVYRIPPMCDVAVHEVVKPIGAAIQEYLFPS
jgi:AcrR family transcriptional regulator